MKVSSTKVGDRCALKRGAPKWGGMQSWGVALPPAVGEGVPGVSGKHHQEVELE